MVVNKKQLADIFGISLPTVRAWIDKGMPVISHGSEGRDYEFSVPDVLQWNINVTKQAELEKRRSPHLRRLRAKIETLELIEESKRMDLEALKAELVLKKDADKTIALAIEVIRNKALTLPIRITPLIVANTDENGVKKTIEDQVRLYLKELSQKFEQEAE